jgi:F-type H+-transporting ATPase subunit c
VKNLVMFVTALLATSSAFAQEAAHTAAVAGTSVAAGTVGSTIGLAALGIGIMMGLAVLGGALGQSNAANAALEGIARNPSAAKEIRGSLVLALALMNLSFFSRS